MRFKIIYRIPGEETQQVITADDFDELESIKFALYENGYDVIDVITYEEEE